MIDRTIFETALLRNAVVYHQDEYQTTVPDPAGPRLRVGWSFYSPAYRWVLGREWDAGPVMCFIMLNPSVGTASEEDATLRRCYRFTIRESCAGFVVVNLFAYRATDPERLVAMARTGHDIVGPGNNAVLRAAVRAGERFRGNYGQTKVVAAWGHHVARPELRDRAAQVCSFLTQTRTRTYVLGTTEHGQPRHPCRLPLDAPLTEWNPADVIPA